MDLLTVSGISKLINRNPVVNEISFNQQPLERIAIAGETGSGKTSLLRMIAGLVQPDAGKILFRNTPVIGPNDQLIPGRKEIAYLSQHFELRNNYWVHEILEYANELEPDRAKILYEVCRIDHLLKRRTDQLSGGEKQRIALARLLSTAPELLLMDEPFSNLDQIHKDIIKSVLSDIGSELKISCILVSHDARDLLSWADTMIIMKEGRIVQQNSPELVYRNPYNEYCAGLLGTYHLFKKGNKNPLLSISGIDTSEKQTILRPEQIYISDTSNKGWKGTLESVSFWGNYYLLGVNVDGELLQVHSTHAQYQKGDVVYLYCNKEDAWQFQ